MAAKSKSTSASSFSSSSSPAASKPKSSSVSSSSKPSLVQASAKRTLKKNLTSNKKNKFRDSQQRELLDGQTTQLLASSSSDAGIKGDGKADPFSYGVEVGAGERRRTRRQVDEAAAALGMLMKS